jgi:hypothetical protein
MSGGHWNPGLAAQARMAALEAAREAGNAPGQTASLLAAIERTAQPEDRDEARAEMLRIQNLPIQVPLTDDEFEAFCQEWTHKSVYEAFRQEQVTLAEHMFRTGKVPDMLIKRLKRRALERGEDESVLDRPIELTVSTAWRLAEDFLRGTRLDLFKWNRIQAEGALAYMQLGGMYGPIAVGWGKTALLQIIASYAYQQGHRKIAWLLPRGLIDQLLRYDMKWARDRFPVSFPPPHSFLDMTPVQRHALATSPKKGVYLIPYSIMSRESSTELLDQIGATLVLADESFLLANEDAAVTKRYLRYCKKTGCQCVQVAGSITKKTIKDYAHLVRLSLKKHSPLPQVAAMLSAWSMVTSTTALPTSVMSSPIVPLINWARLHFPHEDFPQEIAGFRKAYTRRFQSAPGVVSTGENEIDCSLTFRNTPVEGYESVEGWPRLKELIFEWVGIGDEGMWVAPNGDEIEHRIHKFKWLYELSAGCYNELYWPDLEAYAERKSLGLEEAAERLHAGKVHHEARQVYTKFLRVFMQMNPDARGSQGPIDSNMLVAAEMSRTGDKFVPAELYASWLDMQSKEVPGMATRWDRFQPVCPYKINAALEWAAGLPKGEGSIIWVHNVGLGEWAYRVFKEAGMDVVHCPGGDEGSAAVRDEGNKGKHCIASLPAHYYGKNLQHHHNMFCIQFPRDATWAEQMVGRMHRQGQRKDHLFIDSCDTIEPDFLVRAACLNDALYQHQTGGGRQKAVYGAYDPLPRIVPPEVLKQRGLEPIMLDRNQRKLLVEKFGGVL